MSEKSYELSETQLSSIIASGIREWEKSHECKFHSETERPHLHAFARACNLYKVGEDDILVMVYNTKSMGTLIKKSLLYGMAGIVIVFLVALGIVFLQDPMFFIRKLSGN